MPYLLEHFILVVKPFLLVSQVSDGMENSGDDQIEVEWGDRNRLRGRVGRPVYDETVQWSSNHEYKNVKAHTNNSSGSSNNSNSSDRNNNNNNNYSNNTTNSNNTNNNTNTNIGLSSGRAGLFSKADSGVSGNFNSHTSNVESSRGVGINTIEHAYLPSTLSSLQSHSQPQSQPQHSSNSSSSSVSSGVTSRDDRSSSFRISSADNALLSSTAIGMKNIKENGNDEDDLMNFLLDDTNF
jgi:hypothetical protein